MLPSRILTRHVGKTQPCSSRVSSSNWLDPLDVLQELLRNPQRILMRLVCSHLLPPVIEIWRYPEVIRVRLRRGRGGDGELIYEFCLDMESGQT